MKRLFAGYVEAKQAQNVLDYDDLLLYWAQMMSDAELADDIGSRFDHVLVDEYQDTNRLQASVLIAMKPGVSVVMLVTIFGMVLIGNAFFKLSGLFGEDAE